MPRLALVLVLFSYLALFGLRTLVHWRRTGSTGMNAFSGAVGSLPWSAGVLATAGIVTALLAPLASLWGWPGGGLWIRSELLHGLGAVLAAAGIGGALVAQLDLGDSWRIGVKAGERTALVTGGLYTVVRNPIFSFMLLTAAGLVLLLPNSIAVFSAASIFAGIELQVRAVEEPHLLAQHGAAYRAYAARVGRFLPGVGRIDGERGMTPGEGDRVTG